MHPIKSSLLLALSLILLFSASCFAQDQQPLSKTEPQIELYVTSWCPYCKMAEAYLDRQGVEYQSYDVEKDTDAARRMISLAGSGGIPFAVINGISTKGWSEEAYAAALNTDQP